MFEPFRSERDQEQVAQILGYVSAPGLGLVVDPDGRMLAAAGGVPGASAGELAAAAREGRANAALGERFRLHRHALVWGFELLLAVPEGVATSTDRTARAVGLLQRMLVGAALFGDLAIADAAEPEGLGLGSYEGKPS